MGLQKTDGSWYSKEELKNMRMQRHINTTHNVKEYYEDPNEVLELDLEKRLEQIFGNNEGGEE